LHFLCLPKTSKQNNAQTNERKNKKTKDTISDSFLRFLCLHFIVTQIKFPHGVNQFF
jgi:hypothetical protein